MTQEHNHAHNDAYVQGDKLTELFMSQLQTMRDRFEGLQSSEAILRLAVQKLLPNEGDFVELDLPEAVQMEKDDGTIVSKILITRVGDRLTLEDVQ